MVLAVGASWWVRLGVGEGNKIERNVVIIVELGGDKVGNPARRQESNDSQGLGGGCLE